MALCQLWQAARLGFLCRFSFLSDQVNMGTLWKLPQFCLRLQVCDLAPSVTNLPSVLLRAETWIYCRALPKKTRPSRPARKHKREAQGAGLEPGTQNAGRISGGLEASWSKNTSVVLFKNGVNSMFVFFFFFETGKLVIMPRLFAPSALLVVSVDMSRAEHPQGPKCPSHPQTRQNHEPARAGPSSAWPSSSPWALLENNFFFFFYDNSAKIWTFIYARNKIPSLSLHQQFQSMWRSKEAKFSHKAVSSHKEQTA